MARFAGPVIVRRNRAADGRLDFERREVPPRDEIHRPGYRLVRKGEVRSDPPEPSQPGDPDRMLLQFPEERVAENIVHVAGIVGRPAPAFELVRRGRQH
jgi:hypothetical protein